MNRSDRITRGTTAVAVAQLDGTTGTATYWSDAPRPDGSPRVGSVAWYVTEDRRAILVREHDGTRTELAVPVAWELERRAMRDGTTDTTADELVPGDVIVTGDGSILAGSAGAVVSAVEPATDVRGRSLVRLTLTRDGCPYQPGGVRPVVYARARVRVIRPAVAVPVDPVSDAPADDAAGFIYRHAYAYAYGAGEDTAAAYAAWYARTYAGDPLEDCPAHPDAYPRWSRSRVAVPA